MTEIKRTAEAAEELRKDNYAALGPHMAASHQSLRDDFEVSCGELDLMVRIANEIGFEARDPRFTHDGRRLRGLHRHPLPG